ncbi:MAG: alanine dehydrogenase [Acidimicrobiales bacterium]
MAKTLGVPSEVKDGERRVALDPHAVSMLVAAGLEVLVQHDAGVAAGFADADYRMAGGRVVADVGEVWGADLVIKVKEPLPAEWRWFRRGLQLFGYLHLAAEPELTRALQHAGVEGYAFETVVDGHDLPLLAPMSDIAGRTAAIVGAYYLAKGSGTLLGGGAGVPPARVVVIGMGVAGTMAARGARGLDAEVTGVDVDLGRLRALYLDGVVTATIASSPSAVGEAVAGADLVIGAALVPGDRAPIVVSSDQVRSMRHGSVVVDLAIDQGGCIETARPTSLSEPVYEKCGVIHYCVTNVPGQFPRTASRALSAAIAPWVRRLALEPDHPALAGSLNVADGRVVHPVVAASLGTALSAA